MAKRKRKTHARRRNTGPKKSRFSSGAILSILLTGVVIGLMIAFGAYVYTSGKYRTMGDGLGKLYSNIAEPKKPVEQEIKQEVTHLKPHYDYYKILLENERPIPRFDEPVKRPVVKKPVQKQAKTEKTDQPPRKTRSVYMLQVGAFRQKRDAEELKARLAFSGLVASIQRVNLPEKGIFHRVRLGPFSSIDAMNRADTKLAHQGIKAARMQIVQ
ncbi:MAG: hypothetical protein DSZ33_05725 [Gammaproteobacteria bacterium]|nr:MAG: hypothetical protein DSZ33_05725 [Gammaproteobacteria bacterium]